MRKRGHSVAQIWVESCKLERCGFQPQVYVSDRFSCEYLPSPCDYCSKCPASRSCFSCFVFRIAAREMELNKEGSALFGLVQIPVAQSHFSSSMSVHSMFKKSFTLSHSIEYKAITVLPAPLNLSQVQAVSCCSSQDQTHAVTCEVSYHHRPVNRQNWKRDNASFKIRKQCPLDRIPRLA